MSAFSDHIRDFVQEFQVEDLIMRYDVDFDVPLQNEYALGILRMARAFDEAPHGDLNALARRVGAHWCDIVRSDMVYDHWAALRMIEASTDDAATLLEAVRSERNTGPFAAYAAARWQDMTGKIRYRMGSYTRARIAFETAVKVGEQHNLWWALPDMRSNIHRGRYEESRLSGDPDVTRLIDDLTAERDRIRSEAAGHGVGIDDPDSVAPIRQREFLRGYSSVLHNLALAYKDKLKQSGAAENRTESLQTSEDSIRISYALGDQFRIYQSLNHQALVDPARAPELFTQLSTGPYVRGRLIARQHLAVGKHGLDSVRELRKLLDELIKTARDNGSTGIDVHIAAITMDLYAEAVREVLDDDTGDLSEKECKALTDDLADRRFVMAESVRRVVAMPQYKQAYSRTIRPSYLERIANQLASARGPGQSDAEPAEEAFNLVEASSARELLDMLSTATLPELPPLPTLAEGVGKEDLLLGAEQALASLLGPLRGSPVFDDPEADDLGRGVEVIRREAIRRTDDPATAVARPQFMNTEKDFEEAFLHSPLEGTPADPEIAHRVQMFTVNNPDTCVVRYFTYGQTRPTHLGAFVFRRGEMQPVTGIDYAEVERLAATISTKKAPDKTHCEMIWRTLVSPIWPEVNRLGEPEHLVLIPTDDLFAIPLHLAWEPGGARPLAARLPMSQSVSATAFVTRGRSFLRRQPVSATDDLAAIVVADRKAREGRRGVCGGELLTSNWPHERMMILGSRLPSLADVDRHYATDSDGFEQIEKAKPEFFVYAGHGGYDPEFSRTLGPFLDMNGVLLTQYDVALRLKLKRNKLTVLGACLAGQGAKTDSGEVSGFLRSLIAAGAGAIGMPLWSVRDLAMVETVGALLAASRDAVTETRVFEPVQSLFDRYSALADVGLPPVNLIERMPFCL